MSIKGFKSQQALQQTLTGYTEDQSVDKARYVTVQETPGRKHALDVHIHGVFAINAVPQAILAGSNIRKIIATAHGASKNDIIRLSNGTEFSALSTPDANTIITSVELDVSPIGDTFTIWRHITPSYNADGSISASVAPSSIQYDRKTGGITTSTKILEDLDTPANSRPLPVAIHSVDGASITVTAAELNVALSHTNDSVKIGDGTNLAAVSAANALKVDGSAVTQPVSVASLPLPAGSATEATLSALNTKVTTTASGVKVDGSAVTQPVSGTFWQATQPVSAASLPLPAGAATEATVSALNAKVPANLTVTATRLLVDNSGVTQPVSGTFWQATQPVSAASLPLPAGASTDSSVTETHGTKVPGVAATKSELVGAIYTAAGITLTDGQQSALQLDTDGSLRVNVINPARKTGTITQAQLTVGLTAVRATVAGTSPSAIRKKLWIKPAATNTGLIYFGASTVTTANGMQIIGPDRLEFEFDSSDYYVISDTAAQVVEVIEVV